MLTTSISACSIFTHPIVIAEKTAYSINLNFKPQSTLTKEGFVPYDSVNHTDDSDSLPLRLYQ